MTNDVELVIIDNTNTQKWEFSLYKIMAIAFGYEFKEMVIGGRSIEDVKEYVERCTHGIPAAKILEMAYRWEE